MALLYVASESFELEPFSRVLTGLRKLNWPIDYAFEGILEGRRIMLAANGAGPKLAAQAVEVAKRSVIAAELSASRLEAIICTGICGGLDSNLKVNDIVAATSVLDLESGKTFDCTALPAGSGAVEGLVLSQNRVAVNSLEKKELRAKGAIAVEMEAAGVHDGAERAQIPFVCIKAVSDTAEESFALDLNAMRTTEGRFARGKIAVHAVTHPSALSALLHLRRRASQAARALGEFLVSCRIQVESGINIVQE